MNNVTAKEVSLTKDPAIIAPKVDYAFKQMMNSQGNSPIYLLLTSHKLGILCG